MAEVGKKKSDQTLPTRKKNLCLGHILINTWTPKARSLTTGNGWCTHSKVVYENKSSLLKKIIWNYFTNIFVKFVYLILTGGQRTSGARWPCVTSQSREVLKSRGMVGRCCQHPLIVMPRTCQVALATI